MSRRLATPTQAEVRRAIKAAQAAGLEIGAVEIDPKTGCIKVVPKYDYEAPTTNDLDAWLAKHGPRDTQGH